MHSCTILLSKTSFVIYIITNKKTDYQVTTFRNNDNFLDLTRLLSGSRLSAIINASMFCLIRLFDEAGRRTFQVNECVELFFRCRF